MALLARRTAAKDTVAADVAGSILAVAAEEDENAFDSFDSLIRGGGFYVMAPAASHITSRHSS